MDKKRLAVIPARMGSKGLKRKNMALCAGHPLVYWTIKAALEASAFDAICVSTDDKSVVKFALENGAKDSFLRERGLSNDNTSMVSVVKDAIKKCELENEVSYDAVVLLQPTSPLRDGKHIKQALSIFEDKADRPKMSVISVYEADSKLLWAHQVDEHGFLVNHYKFNKQNPRRQSLDKCFIPNGAIYIADASGFHGFYGDKLLPYVMSSVDSVDIDDSDDLISAEKALLNKKFSATHDDEI